MNTMKSTNKKIPIVAVKELANKYGYDQVIVHGFDHKSNTQSVATFGRSKADCENAAIGGNEIKKLLQWPEKMCNAKPRGYKTMIDEEVKQLLKALEEIPDREGSDGGKLVSYVAASVIAKSINNRLKGKV
jgi:hypothetical protein